MTSRRQYHYGQMTSETLRKDCFKKRLKENFSLNQMKESSGHFDDSHQPGFDKNSPGSAARRVTMMGGAYSGPTSSSSQTTRPSVEKAMTLGGGVPAPPTHRQDAPPYNEGLSKVRVDPIKELNGMFALNTLFTYWKYS